MIELIYSLHTPLAFINVKLQKQRLFKANDITEQMKAKRYHYNKRPRKVNIGQKRNKKIQKEKLKAHPKNHRGPSQPNK
jgi:hypothetical protein